MKRFEASPLGGEECMTAMASAPGRVPLSAHMSVQRDNLKSDIWKMLRYAYVTELKAVGELSNAPPVKCLLISYANVTIVPALLE